MRHEDVVTVLRSEYRPPAFLVDSVALEFDLDAVRTLVTATLRVRRNDAVAGGPLRLDGEELELLSVQIDGRDAGERASLEGGALVFEPPSDRFTLRVRNAIRPRDNSALMGLYLSNGSLFTQCEAEGFRRITFFPDRPDVMARYEVLLRADPQPFPVLLSNGNLAAEGLLPDGRRFARWVDPFPKPSYLFALVAGRFECREQTLRTKSGREVRLQVWVAPGQLERTGHALDSLVKAIRWDEERFGLELDLDRYMIVASNDFNMGAMENKGLNIFNAKYVLADPAVATDEDYSHIASIVAHEYFHNWTGNRVTCRDWFQLSLKEGLTVFRDQEFAADLLGGASGRAVRRIEDVRTLRAAQFPEDAGPQAHPVRPDSYQEIGNFYTATVYEKGAEVVRMLHTLCGTDGFRRGLQRYLQDNDGQAVTCEHLVDAMAKANGRDLAQFTRWYAQAGTPRVAVSTACDEAGRTYELTLSQTCPPTPGQPDKEPFHIPFVVGLVGADGADVPLRLEGEAGPAGGSRLLELTAPVQTFRFVDVDRPVVPSLARGFSAPIVVDYRYSDQELAFLAAHDSDPFNRWEAGQRLAVGQLLAVTDAFETGRPPHVDRPLIDVFGAILADDALAPGFREQALQLPAEPFLAEQRAMVDPEAIRSARQRVRRELGLQLADAWQRAYEAFATPGPYSPDPQSAARRGLRNLALNYLVDSGTPEALRLAHAQLDAATNMTDRQAALAAIVNARDPDKAAVLLRLARQWQHEPLLMNKWFQLQATAIAWDGEPPVLARVKTLLRHPAFALTNPNNVYALVLGFCAHNPAEFHRSDGSGYRFWVEMVLRLDALNPTVAARVARALDRWRKYTPDRQRQMRDALREVAAARHLSRDVREIVGKALAN
jgi:aminopeptidase N